MVHGEKASICLRSSSFKGLYRKMNSFLLDSAKPICLQIPVPSETTSLQTALLFGIHETQKHLVIVCIKDAP